MEYFTPVSAIAGGLLIGSAAALLWLALGRIAGISGILGSVFGSDAAWRAAFLLGLMAAPLLYALAGVEWSPVELGLPQPMILLAGVLVGVGTRLGAGCTSGHGVCGIARLSPRSIAATATFMATAMATVFVARHVIGG